MGAMRISSRLSASAAASASVAALALSRMAIHAAKRARGGRSRHAFQLCSVRWWESNDLLGFDPRIPSRQPATADQNPVGLAERLSWWCRASDLPDVGIDSCRDSIASRRGLGCLWLLAFPCRLEPSRSISGEQRSPYPAIFATSSHAILDLVPGFLASDEEFVVLSRWPIRKKLTFSLCILVVLIVILTVSGINGIYKYRGLARGVSCRATELPLASDFARHISELRVTFTSMTGPRHFVSQPGPMSDMGLDVGLPILQQKFASDLQLAHDKIREYRNQFHRNQLIEEANWRSDSNQDEGLTLHEIECAFDLIERECNDDEEWFANAEKVEVVRTKLDELQCHSKVLPSYLQNRMKSFKDDVAVRYRAAIVGTWLTLLTALVVTGLLARLLYVWILKPLQALIRGSRRVAAGEFDHRIQVESQDEIAGLADAMNDMTMRFREIRDDLDEQVRQRSKEVVRSEQLASVGFLAAGVAHEINNPLAAVALCAESLEERLHSIFQCDDALPDNEHNEEISICRNYLRVIQDEAFRCKEITEKLLDFARMGNVEREASDLGDVVRSVNEMVGHLGKYKNKEVTCEVDQAVIGMVNVQEFKQVVLNLLTNALDSVDPNGHVVVKLQKRCGKAVLSVVDDGCGMSEETIRHIFEPFFTRRRDGQGTGLGLSITYGIVRDHGGEIQASSKGENQGSEFTVTMPLAAEQQMKESYYQHQAA